MDSAREASVEGGRVERLETRIDAGKLKGLLKRFTLEAKHGG